MFGGQPRGISPMNSLKLRSWVKSGCNAQEMVILKRPSAQTDPNTFVIMWKNPVGLPGVQHVCLDVHYEGGQIEAGKPLKALGGFWAKGITGDLKPQQSDDLMFKNALLALAPQVSPDPDGMDNFGNY